MVKMSDERVGRKKEKYDNSQKVYEKQNYIILKVKSGKKIGYIAYNTRKEWEEGHTHLESFNMAKTIIDNVIKHKKPKTKNLYLLQSHIRLTDDPSYVRFINEVIDAKKNKRKSGYRNERYFIKER